MAPHDRRFKHEHAHKLDDPERATWLPVAPLVARLGLKSGTIVADLGAGTGYFALPMARAVAPAGKVFALDVSPEMLAHLRARIEPGTTVELVEADAARTGLPNACCDVVLMANVWHEFDDAVEVLREAARIVRPHGTLAILDWRADLESPPGPPTAHRVASQAVVDTLLANGWTPDAPEHFGRYSHLVVATRP